MANARQQKKKKINYLKCKKCVFCSTNAPEISYKNVEVLKKYISKCGKIIPRRLTGVCAKHQKLLAIAIKRARQVAFLPYIN